MIGWWNDLSPRERAMLLVTGALAAVLILTLSVIRPLSAWRDGAAQKARSAWDAYELTVAAASVAGEGAALVSGSGAPLRDALLRTAAAAGFEIIRVGSENNGQIELQLAPAEGEAFFAWIAELQGRHGIHVAFADMTPTESGLINAQVLVFEQR